MFNFFLNFLDFLDFWILKFSKKNCRFVSEIFSGRFDTSGSMIPLSVPEIEGGSPEHDGGKEGLVLAYSSSWIH